jgi:hypothetical protein
MALAMFLVRDAHCPALTQERAMAAEFDSPATPSRALVTLVAKPHDAHPHRSVQRAALFLTQLIASASRVPQVRERRRAEASEVIAAYRATVERLQRLNEQSH